MTKQPTFPTLAKPVEDTCKAGHVSQPTSGLILNRVRDGIVLQDIQGRVEWANPACEEMYGWTLENMRGRKPLEFVLPPEARPDAKGIETFHYDIESSLFNRYKITEHLRRDGSRFWNQQSFAIIDSGGGDAGKKIVITCRDVTEQVNTENALRQVQVDLEHAAHHDDLTGLANRKKLTEFLKSDRVRHHITEREIGVLQIDIDKFKDINDTLGHAAGDATLKHIARALKASCGERDLVCRTGGDEFLLICLGTGAQDALMARADALHKAIEEPLNWESQVIRVGTSIGASLPLRPDTSGEALIQMADQALYAAKGRGRGQVMVYDEYLGRAQKSQQQLVSDLKTAVAEGQFKIYLQPQLHLPSNRITGCEALLRWAHPERGILPPGTFLDDAEKNGLLAEIDYISMNLALDALVRLRAAGLPAFCMSINVSSSILADVNYPGLLDWGLQSRGIEPGSICIEILETTILDRGDLDVMTAVDQLKKLGVRVALDDFGTGYAGLAHMSSFDIDAIKLDRSMIGRLENDPRNRIIIRSIIRLCALLGMKVVAEGVETQGQLDILRRTNCPIIQGFGLARPMCLDDMVDWMNRMTKDGFPTQMGRFGT